MRIFNDFKIPNEEELPRYHNVNGVLLIGVCHGNGLPEKVEEFRERLKGLEILAFEGEDEDNSSPNEDGKVCFESLAYQEFTGERVFLEEGINPPILITKQGMSDFLYGIHMLISATEEISHAAIRDAYINKKPLRESVADVSHSLSDHHVKKGLFPESIDRDQIVRAYVEIFDACLADAGQDGLTILAGSGNISHAYFGQVRNAAMAPKLAELASHKKRIGSITGSFHIDLFADFLEGKPPEIVSWHEYVEMHGPEIRKLIGNIESVGNSALS